MIFNEEMVDAAVNQPVNKTMHPLQISANSSLAGVCLRCCNEGSSA